MAVPHRPQPRKRVFSSTTLTRPMAGAALAALAAPAIEVLHERITLPFLRAPLCPHPHQELPRHRQNEPRQQCSDAERRPGQTALPRLGSARGPRLVRAGARPRAVIHGGRHCARGCLLCVRVVRRGDREVTDACRARARVERLGDGWRRGRSRRWQPLPAPRSRP